MVNGIDYNGKQGRHPNNCDCVKHNSANPMQITQGENKVTTPTYNEAIITALANNPEALKVYMASVNSIPANLNPNPNPVPNSVVQTPSLPMLDEYVIPLTDPIHKQSGFSTMQDARNLPTQFDSKAEAVRITKIYANKGILGTDKWELVLRKVK